MICVMIMINIILRILQVITLILTTIFCFFYSPSFILEIRVLDIPKYITSWIILSPFLIYVILMSIILLMKLKECDFADDTILNFCPTGIFLVNILSMKFMDWDLINILKENWKEALLFVLLFYIILILVKIYNNEEKIINRIFNKERRKNEKKTFK